MAATWPGSGSFDAAVWESRMAGPAAPSPANHMIHTLRLRRASRLLRERLNRMEDPAGPLSPHQKRLLGHQTHRLSRVVEALLFAAKRREGKVPAA